MSRPVPLRLLLALAAGTGGLACAMDLPLQERIASTRPLAMRVDVVDPTADPEAAVRNEALPLETIAITPLLVDPAGVLDDARIEAEVQPVWLACPLQPIEGVFGCLSSRLPLALEDIEACPTVDLASLDLQSGNVPQVPVPCRIEAGTPARPQLQVPIHPNLLIGGDLEITMIGHVPGESSTEACAEAVLGQADELSASCIVASHRASVGPDSEILALASAFGIEGLGEVDVAAPPEPPAPDTHPRILTFTVAITDENDEVLQTLEVARGDTVVVAPGQSLQIVTTTDEADLQTYYIAQDNDQFEETREFLNGSWFRTWGELLSPVSDDPMSMNTWTMVPGEQDEREPQRPPDDRATLYYVLRDSRQGVDWWWFSVDVTAP